LAKVVDMLDLSLPTTPVSRSVASAADFNIMWTGVSYERKFLKKVVESKQSSPKHEQSSHKTKMPLCSFWTAVRIQSRTIAFKGGFVIFCYDNVYTNKDITRVFDILRSSIECRLCICVITLFYMYYIIIFYCYRSVYGSLFMSSICSFVFWFNLYKELQLVTITITLLSVCIAGRWKYPTSYANKRHTVYQKHGV